MAAGTGGTATLDTKGEYLFQLGATDGRDAACTTFRVCADSGNGANVLVLVTGLHDSGAEAVLGPGEEALYRNTEMAIREVFAKASSGTQTVRWGVRARTGGGP